MFRLALALVPALAVSGAIAPVAFSQNRDAPIDMVVCNERSVGEFTYSFVIRPREGVGRVEVGFPGGSTDVRLDRWNGSSNRGFVVLGETRNGNNISFIREFNSSTGAWGYRFNHWGQTAEGGRLEASGGLTCRAVRF